MSRISYLKAREILDSRARPTVEVDAVLDSGSRGRAAVPSGASTGEYEAHELRDGDKSRYSGKGVLQAVNHVNTQISHHLKDMDPSDQSAIDNRLIELDGTENKSRLGANAILGASLACAKAAAVENRTSLYRSLNGKNDCRLPVPLMNVLNGGAHANNGLDVQEFMIVPVTGDSFKEALRAGSETFNTLKSLLNEKGYSTAVGDEGGFAPALNTNQQALEFLLRAIEKAGYQPGEEIGLAVDVAATELQDQNNYKWQEARVSANELMDIYSTWLKDFPLFSIEDGFGEDDWDNWSEFTRRYNNKCQVVGDDLFVTNPERLQTGIEKKAANSLLVKVNQIGTLTETRSAVQMARDAGYTTVMSHRSGETEDTFIADLAVALGCEQLKSGSPCRSERVAKYNQLLRIEEKEGHFWGMKAFPAVKAQ